ncbi:helix-turn-helix domain-containing protein [Streptomyces tendae]|uniref:Helix-turn-helix domain-containing protein n=1 Tax=Streptomyces tendae TaxID=1932 RepID=A0A6B3QSY0_STRTE|nr:helix-turn-helix domain-containing protein [Streptomyces tendae]
MPQRRAITGRSQEPRARFAEELRLLRHRRGVSLRGVAEVVGWDASQFGKMENGHTLGGPEIVEALDQYYATGGMLLTLWELAVADPTQFREQYRRYMILEAEAISLWHYAVSAPPGLLQTAGYAREALAVGWLKGPELEQQVEARLGRRQLLDGEAPPPFRVILSEAVLRTSLRDVEAWREQLTHLAEMAERPSITLQVLPFRAGPHGLMNTSVMFLRLSDGRVVAYTENDLRGELVEENDSVELLQRRYDAMRDLALSPAESREFILRTLEEAPCESSI